MILRSFSSFLSFLIHSHSHPLTSSHLCLNFITWITVCTNEQIYWYCLTSFFKKGFMLYYFVLYPLHLKVSLENYSMPVIEIFIFAAAMEHLTRLRVCTYKLMRMTNCIFDCDDSSYSNQNTVPHDLLPEFFSPSCLHESENTRVSHSVSCPCSAWRLSFSSQLSLLAQAGLGSVLWSPFRPESLVSDSPGLCLAPGAVCHTDSPWAAAWSPARVSVSPGAPPARWPCFDTQTSARRVRPSWVHSRFIFRSWLPCCTHSLLAKYLGCCPICRRRLGSKF